MEEHHYLKQLRRSVWAGDVSTYKQVRAMKEANMAEQESNVCAICGGVKSLGGFVQAERDGNGVKFLAYDGHPACIGHPEPAPKHDGSLDEYGDGMVEISGSRVVVSYQDQKAGGFAPVEAVHLTPKQAFSLRDWLIQESPTLERLVKEQERE